jgi:hypothetical protein
MRSTLNYGLRLGTVAIAFLLVASGAVFMALAVAAVLALLLKLEDRR